VDHCKKIKWFDEVDSTNSKLLSDKDSLCSGTIYSALYQTAGRGQKGNRWEAHRGENLMFSLLFKPNSLPAGRQFVISQATALAILQFLRGLGLTPQIKWPNDILIGKKKICGILIENTLSTCRDSATLSASIIGVGLNLNQKEFPKELARATSAALETGRTFDIYEALDTIADLLLENLSKCETPEGIQWLESEYLKNLYRLGEWHDFIDRSECDPLVPTTEAVDGAVFRGRIKGVLENGCLLLENEKGEDKAFAFKQLSYIF